MTATGVARKLRYLVTRHRLLYQFRYALITELGGLDFTRHEPGASSRGGPVPREFLEIVSREELRGKNGGSDARKIALDLSHGHPRGPGMGLRSVDTLKRIYSGERAGVCSDYCQVFLGLCRAAGIEAREWGLCARFDAPDVGHALTEIYSQRDGKWIFFDPFFSIRAAKRGDSRPLAFTEMIDLASAGRAGEIDLERIDPGAVPEEMYDGYVGRFLDPNHAFFLLSNNDVFQQDRFLRWRRVVPLPVLHMAMILTGNYQRFHIYTNSRNRERMARRLRELKRWFLRCILAAVLLILLASASALVIFF